MANFRGATIVIAVITVVFSVIAMINDFRFDEDNFRSILTEYDALYPEQKLDVNDITNYISVTYKVRVKTYQLVVL